MAVKVWSVLGNSQKLDGGAMFGNAPRVVWEKWCPPDEQGRIDLACRSMLADIDGKKVLFETGIGAFFAPKYAERFGVQNYETHLLLENLKKIAIKPEDIDAVVLSHLHFDHAGGLLPSYKEIQAGNNGIVFSNADIYVGDQAWLRAQNPHPRDRASFIEDLPQKLEATGKLRIIAENETLFNNRLSFFTSNGHTPGQLHAVLNGDKEVMVFCGDLIPGTAWVHLPITMGYDRFPEKVIDEKSEFYQQAVNNSYNLFYTHDWDTSCSKVQRTERGKIEAFDLKSTLASFEL